MKKYQVLEIIYPIGLYYLISGVVFFALNILMGESQDIYMMKQLISSGATIPFLASLYKQDTYTEKVVYGKQKRNFGKNMVQIVLTAVSAGAFGVALNNFIAMTPLVEVSAGFQNANENFFAGGILLEILASCVVVPVAEELLFRGSILKRVSMMADEKVGILCSALLFGVIHMNLVQFIYATLLGALLAVIVVKTGRVSLAIIGHAFANLIAVLRAETGVLDFSYQPDLAGIGFSLLMVAVGSIALWLLIARYAKIARSINAVK